MRLHVLLPALLLMASTLHGQDLEASVFFGVGVPVNEFGDNVTNNGYGLTANFGYAPEKNPYLIGLSLGYLNYGSETRAERFSTTIPDVTVDVTRSNNIALVHLLLRVQPNTGGVRPYLQGVAGLNYLFTETEVKSRTGSQVASSTNQSDVAFSYGAGGGVMFRVHDAGDEPSDGLRQVLIDIGARYTFGGRATYLKEGAIEIRDGHVFYHPTTSKTDLIVFEIGVAFRF